MRTYQIIVSVMLALLLWPQLCLAEDSAHDADLSVAPVVRQYPVTQLSTTSAAAIFTIKNTHAWASLNLLDITLEGTNFDEFSIGGHNCYAPLTAGSSCDVPVSFAPLTRGSKNAELRIHSDDAETPVLTAYLTNLISPLVEAQGRMPPVLASNDIPETMLAGENYTLLWTLEGYHEDYFSYAVLFDCTDETDCGASYIDDSKFAESAVLSAVSVTPGDWTYHGTATQLHTYEWNFTVPALRADNITPWAGTDIVVRLYRKSNIDAERINTSVSLLIPGNQSLRYYGTSGRRILKTIDP
jgi:hypothetical protein